MLCDAKNFHPNLLIPHCIVLAFSYPCHDDISRVCVYALDILLAFPNAATTNCEGVTALRYFLPSIVLAFSLSLK